ncbi:hypothetical protein PPSIR1_02041 [Plesiocystis pacifica SIR-1]|uniref:Lipoprotein n=1 Tax=Plesiocystis pacifica SIR-1 TaxID=391625 RepID=A6GIM9_9BACT|nr:hypothetical protein [Plesiocystis pacifica]EDM74278.1 hypothetical protein PPSIR1_02041 [Plesiocystis pacifica SIR-1]
MQTRDLAALTLGLTFLGALACVPPDADDEGLGDSDETGASDTANDESESESESGGESESESGGESESESESGPEGETTWGGADGPSDEGGGEFPECEASEGASFSWSYTVQNNTLSEGLDAGSISVEWTCTVASTAGGAGLHVTLDCPEDELVELDLDASPAFTLDPPLAVGESLELQVGASGCFGCDTGAKVALQLHRDGAHLLTHRHDNEWFELPVEVAFVDDLCPEQPLDYCGPRRRRAAQISSEGETLQLFDGHSGSVAGLDVWAKELWVREPGDEGWCEHTTYSMANMLFVATEN